MFGTHDLLLFILAGWLLNITPGPDTAYIVARSTQLGLRGGTMAVAGIGAGIMVHITAAALGISALIAASATAFSIVKYLGAGYLIYIGMRLIFARRYNAGEAAVAIKAPPPHLAKVFRQGFITNALNPKVALFFLAFLPQFISSNAHSKALAFLFLGIVFNINGSIWNLFVAWIAARATSLVCGAKPLQRWIDCMIGTMFIGLGIKLAVFQRG